MMVNKAFFFMVSFCLTISVANAQMKTVELDEVIVEALPFEKYSTGSKIEKSDSLQLVSLGQSTLSDYIQQNTTVYIKEQGNKMLASVSFRGTGSSHTGVFWHGISLNALTLGNSDFNGYPLFLFDDIAVQYGGASSLHGSDAIGGSIHLSSTPEWTEGTKIQIQQDFGSFGNVFTGLKVNVGNGKWESKTRIFNRLLKNNFTYNITDRLGNSFNVTQENAEVHNYGILQEFNRQVKRNGFFAVKGWLGRNYHQVQPLMAIDPDDVQTGDEIVDRNLRFVAEYDHFFENGFFNSGIGYVWDYQLYNNSDVIETKRLIANLDYEWNIGANTTLKAGGNSKYIIPNVWSYKDDITEWRGDVFLSFNQLLIKNWQVSLNARKTFVPFTKSPVAPSLTTSYEIQKTRYRMAFRGQVERSFRVPTFNDRYWPIPGLIERPDLRSESGYSTELGHNLTYQKGRFTLESDMTLYYMKIDDWIMWVPIGIEWMPKNKKKVEGSGVELSAKINMDLSHWSFDLGGMYAFNNSVLLEGVSEDDPAVGYQLPYTPQHRAVLFANMNYKNFRLSINNNYTGERNGIDVRNEKVDGYLVTDIGLSRRIALGKQLLTLEGKVLNLFDAEYQNVNHYAMPGRNYLISINFFINN